MHYFWAGVQVYGDTVIFTWSGNSTGYDRHGAQKRCGCSASITHFTEEKFGQDIDDQVQFVNVTLGML